MLIDGQHLNLIVAREAIHEWKYDTSSIVVDNLIDMWSRKVVLGTIFIQVSKIDTDSNGALLFIDRDNVRYPFRQVYWINKPSFEKFLNFSFNNYGLPRIALVFAW